jgi:hypothetical protein
MKKERARLEKPFHQNKRTKTQTKMQTKTNGVNAHEMKISWMNRWTDIFYLWFLL